MNDYRINWVMIVPTIGNKVVAPTPEPTPDPVRLFETENFDGRRIADRLREASKPVPMEDSDPHARYPFPAKCPARDWVYEVFGEKLTFERRFCYWDGVHFCKFVTDNYGASVEEAIEHARTKMEPTNMQITAWRIAPERPLP